MRKATAMPWPFLVCARQWLRRMKARKYGDLARENVSFAQNRLKIGQKSPALFTD
jgi:hypothetical protein